MLSEMQLKLIEHYLGLNKTIVDKPETVFLLMLQEYIDNKTTQYLPKNITKTRLNQGIMLFSEKFVKNSPHASACRLMSRLRESNIHNPEEFLTFLAQNSEINTLLNQDDFVALLVAYFYSYDMLYPLNKYEIFNSLLIEIENYRHIKHEQNQTYIDEQYFQSTLKSLNTLSKNELRHARYLYGQLNDFLFLLSKDKPQININLFLENLLPLLKNLIHSPFENIALDKKIDHHSLADHCHCIAKICKILGNLVSFLTEDKRAELFDVLVNHIKYLINHGFHDDTASSYCINALCQTMSKYEAKFYSNKHIEEAISPLFEEYPNFIKTPNDASFRNKNKPLLQSTLIFKLPIEKYPDYIDRLLKVLQNNSNHVNIRGDALLAISMLIPFLPKDQQQQYITIALCLGEKIYVPEYNRAIINLAPFISQNEQLGIIKKLKFSQALYDKNSGKALQRILPFCSNNIFEFLLDGAVSTTIENNNDNILYLIKLLPFVSQEDQDKIISIAKTLADDISTDIVEKENIIACFKQLKPYLSSEEYNFYFNKFLTDFIIRAANNLGNAGSPQEVNIALWDLAHDNEDLQKQIVDTFLKKLASDTFEAKYTIDGLKKLLPTLKINDLNLHKDIETYLLKYLTSRPDSLEENILKLDSLLDFITDEKLLTIYSLLEAKLTENLKVNIVGILKAMQLINLSLDKHKQVTEALQEQGLGDKNIIRYIKSFGC